MSGRGARGGGRGGRGRGGFGSKLGLGPGGVLPMGLTYTDIQSMSREATALYPPLDPLPTLKEFSKEEQRICEVQIGFASRLRNSPYYLVGKSKSTDLPRYSDKYRPVSASRPILRKKDLHHPFFPAQIYDDYFNPKRKKKVDAKLPRTVTQINLDEIEDVDEQKNRSSEERSDHGSQVDASDYDVEEEYDNDYADNYFDNGENDDMDDLGGAGGDDGGGIGDYE